MCGLQTNPHLLIKKIQWHNISKLKEVDSKEISKVKINETLQTRFNDVYEEGHFMRTFRCLWFAFWLYLDL